MTYEDALLKVLCEIHNRLTEIAVTLQTAGILSVAKEDSEKQEWTKKLSELLLEQSKKYATLEIVKA